MGAPTYHVTHDDKLKVETLASFGVPGEKIANYIGISRTTLYKYYGDVLAKARINRVMEVASCLFHNATSNMNVASQIYYLKTQGKDLGWTESSAETIELEDKNVGKIEINVVKPGEVKK